MGFLAGSLPVHPGTDPCHAQEFVYDLFCGKNGVVGVFEFRLPTFAGLAVQRPKLPPMRFSPKNPAVVRETPYARRSSQQASVPCDLTHRLRMANRTLNLSPSSRFKPEDVLYTVSTATPKWPMTEQPKDQFLKHLDHLKEQAALADPGLKERVLTAIMSGPMSSPTVKFVYMYWKTA
jgi:hypothetical protein